MNNIYDQHKAAFASVSAFVILKDGERVATIAIKFPRDGAGRLHAYVHWIGLEMVRGFASGGGYDKRTAAVSSAARSARDPIDITKRIPNMDRLADYDTFRAALSKDDGTDWTRQLEAVGFTVFQAV